MPVIRAILANFVFDCLIYYNASGSFVKPVLMGLGARSGVYLSGHVKISIEAIFFAKLWPRMSSL